MEKIEFTDDCPPGHRKAILVHTIARTIKAWERAEGVIVLNVWHTEEGGLNVEYRPVNQKRNVWPVIEGETGRLHHMIDDLKDLEKDHRLILQHVAQTRPGRMFFWLQPEDGGEQEHYQLKPVEAEAVPA